MPNWKSQRCTADHCPQALARKTAHAATLDLEHALLDTMQLPSLENVAKVVVDENTVANDSAPLLICRRLHYQRQLACRFVGFPGSNQIPLRADVFRAIRLNGLTWTGDRAVLPGKTAQYGPVSPLPATHFRFSCTISRPATLDFGWLVAIFQAAQALILRWLVTARAHDDQRCALASAFNLHER